MSKAEYDQKYYRENMKRISCLLNMKNPKDKQIYEFMQTLDNKHAWTKRALYYMMMFTDKLSADDLDDELDNGS